MTNLIWSISLAAIGILGIYLAGNKSQWGWALGFGAQLLWAVFAVVTGQYGFILSAVAYGIVYGRNWGKWHVSKAERRRMDESEELGPAPGPNPHWGTTPRPCTPACADGCEGN